MPDKNDKDGQIELLREALRKIADELRPRSVEHYEVWYGDDGVGYVDLGFLKPLIEKADQALADTTF